MSDNPVYQVLSAVFILAVLYGVYHFVIKPRRRKGGSGSGGGGKSEPGDSNEH